MSNEFHDKSIRNEERESNEKVENYVPDIQNYKFHFLETLYSAFNRRGPGAKSEIFSIFLC